MVPQFRKHLLRNGKASVAVRVYPASAVVRVWVFRRNWENIK
jgi:hypothetical protein